MQKVAFMDLELRSLHGALKEMCLTSILLLTSMIKWNAPKLFLNKEKKCTKRQLADQALTKQGRMYWQHLFDLNIRSETAAVYAE